MNAADRHLRLRLDRTSRQQAYAGQDFFNFQGLSANFLNSAN
jgi:hypothetical protein